MKKIKITSILMLMMFALSFLTIFPASAISPSDAVVNIDFANGIPDGMEVVGAELVTDADKGQVMSFAGGSTGSSKANLPMESLATTDFKSGISWAVWVKAQDGIHGLSPIFTINLTNVGYLTLLSDLMVTANSDGNDTSWGIDRVWSDPPQPVEEEVSALKNEWTHLAVSIDSNGVNLYVNGKIHDKYPFDAGNFADMTDVMMEEMTYATGIMLGSYNCEWWKFGDFAGLMSSAALYNKALSADEIKELFVNSGGVYVEDPVTEAPTEPETTVAAETETTVADNNDTIADENTDAASDTNPTTTNSTDDTENNNSMLTIILIIAGVVVIVVIIALIVKSSKKK